MHDVIHKFNMNMRQILSLLQEQTKLVDGIEPTLGEPFDMHTAIKASGQWECGDLKCSGCTTAQNKDCVATYSIKLPAHVQTVYADEIKVRHALHVGLVNVEAPVARPQLPISIRVVAKEPEPKIEPVKKTKAPPALTDMKRPELIKLASSLGVKEVTKRTIVDLVKAIDRKRAKK